MTSKLRLLVVHVLLPLLAGVLVYILFRHNTWFHIHILSVNRASPFIKLNGAAGNIISYQFPDFCWSYSIAASLILWQISYKVNFSGFSLFVLLIVVAAEVIQLLMPHSFTFDWADILAALLAFLLSFYTLVYYEKS